MTAHVYSKEGIQVLVPINQKLSVGEIVFLGELLKKLCCWIDLSSVEEIDTE